MCIGAVSGDVAAGRSGFRPSAPRAAHNGASRLAKVGTTQYSCKDHPNRQHSWKSRLYSAAGDCRLWCGDQVAPGKDILKKLNFSIEIRHMLVRQCRLSLEMLVHLLELFL